MRNRLQSVNLGVWKTYYSTAYMGGIEIYDSPLTPQEVKKIYLKGLRPWCKN
jgi:hypothetical protein